MSAEFVLDTAVVRAFVTDVRATIAGASSPQDSCVVVGIDSCVVAGVSWPFWGSPMSASSPRLRRPARAGLQRDYGFRLRTRTLP